MRWDGEEKLQKKNPHSCQRILIRGPGAGMQLILETGTKDSHVILKHGTISRSNLIPLNTGSDFAFTHSRQSWNNITLNLSR